MLLLNGMFEKFATALVHPSQRGFVRGRDLLVNVAELDGAVTGFLYDDESELAAVLLGIAAAFPSAEWEIVRWALERQGVPRALADALFAMYGPTAAEVYLNGRASGCCMPVTCGIRQGCLASGTVWALLYDPVVRFLWGSLPRDDLWLTVSSDDIALALCNVFRDLRFVRRALEVASATGLRLNARKSVVINFTRRAHMVVQDIACDGNGFLVSGTGRYLGFVFGPDTGGVRWAQVRAKFLARARPTSGPLACTRLAFRWPTTHTP